MNLKREIIAVIFGFVLGMVVYHYYSDQDITKSKITANLKSHSVIDEMDKEAGVQVFVLSNPTCESCDNIYGNICNQLSMTNTSYKAILYPENNIDIWLAVLLEALIEDLPGANTKLSAKNKKLQLFKWLKDNRQLWEDMTNIDDFVALLAKNKQYDPAKAQEVVSNKDRYWESYMYTNSLSEIFNVQGIPTVAICLVLSGSEFDWSDVEPIVAKMKQIYQKLKKENKVL